MKHGLFLTSSERAESSRNLLRCFHNRTSYFSPTKTTEREKHVVTPATSLNYSEFILKKLPRFLQNGDEIWKRRYVPRFFQQFLCCLCLKKAFVADELPFPQNF